jgi:hypothetical protein
MPSSDAVRGNPKLEKTSKLVTTTLLVCKEATALGWAKHKLEKTSKH